MAGAVRKLGNSLKIVWLLAGLILILIFFRSTGDNFGLVSQSKSTLIDRSTFILMLPHQLLIIKIIRE